MFVPQTEAPLRVESDSAEERVWRDGGDLRAGLHQGGQQGWRGHLGGAAPLQAGVGSSNKDKEILGVISCCLCLVRVNPFRP